MNFLVTRKLIEDEKYKNDVFTDICNEAINFNDILKKAIDGLNKLKGTYEDDKTFVAKIEIEINLLSRLLNKHNEKEKII